MSSWWQHIEAAAKRSTRDRVTTNAASLALHWFLAIVPGAIALTGLANLAGLPKQRVHHLVHGMSVLLPSAAANTLDAALTSPASSGSNIVALVLGALVALWASLEASVALQFALDMAYETKGDRGFFARRVRGLALIGATIVFGGGAFVLLVLGGPLGSLILPHGGRSLVAPVWSIGRWVIGIACALVLVSLYNFFGPNRTDRHWKLLSIGGSVSTALWLAIAVAYSYYLDHFGRSTQTYGSLAGVVCLEVWLFLSALVILIGAELNQELERHDARPR
jgi:membrane protein